MFLAHFPKGGTGSKTALLRNGGENRNKRQEVGSHDDKKLYLLKRLRPNCSKYAFPQ
jgi:hypothetical protein